MVDWVGQAKGLAFPLGYLTLLIGLMSTFSSLYRKRQAARAASLEPWFPPHLQRNVYLSLLHLDQPDPPREKPITVPDSVIKAALLRRAVEDIQRLISLRTSKVALQQLLQRGSVGDDLWQRFQRGEKEIEAELQDVVAEANALAPGWGQSIFQSANEMAANQRLRERIAEMQGKAGEERSWWDRKRKEMQDGLMEELELEESNNRKGSTVTTTTGSSDGEGVLVEGPPAASSTGKKKKGKGKK